MATLLATRTASGVMSSEFVFTVSDSMKDTTGALTAFTTFAKSWDVINLPVGAEIVGGGMTVETAAATSTTFTLAIASANASPVALLAATTMMTAGYTALTLTGTTKPNLACTNGDNIRITTAGTGSAPTAFVVRVRVDYVLPSKADYVVPA